MSSRFHTAAGGGGVDSCEEVFFELASSVFALVVAVAAARNGTKARPSGKRTARFTAVCMGVAAAGVIAGASVGAGVAESAAGGAGISAGAGVGAGAGATTARKAARGEATSAEMNFGLYDNEKYKNNVCKHVKVFVRVRVRVRECVCASTYFACIPCLSNAITAKVRSGPGHGQRMCAYWVCVCVCVDMHTMG